MTSVTRQEFLYFFEELRKRNDVLDQSYSSGLVGNNAVAGNVTLKIAPFLKKKKNPLQIN